MLDAENVRCMRQNGVVVWLRRPLGELAVGGYRPLSKCVDALREMEARRAPLYAAAAHVTVDNNGAPADTETAVRGAFYEISRHQWT